MHPPGTSCCQAVQFTPTCMLGYQACAVCMAQVELQTARQKVVLYDTAAAPLPLMGPGHHHDFMVQHDIKELGMHTLVCSAVYTAADGERRYFPENFKFSSTNPLMVKTKVKSTDQKIPCCLNVTILCLLTCFTAIALHSIAKTSML